MSSTIHLAELLKIAEHGRLKLAAEISSIIAKGGGITNALQACAESLVRHLDAAFARIWTLNEPEQVLELQASTGIYTNLNGVHMRCGRVDVLIGRKFGNAR